MLPLCPKAPAMKVIGTWDLAPPKARAQGGVHLAGQPPRLPAPTLARSPLGPGVQDRTDNPKAPGLLTVDIIYIYIYKECVMMRHNDATRILSLWRLAPQSSKWRERALVGGAGDRRA